MGALSQTDGEIDRL